MATKRKRRRASIDPAAVARAIEPVHVPFANTVEKPTERSVRPQLIVTNETALEVYLDALLGD